MAAKQQGEGDGRENVADEVLSDPQILTTLPSTVTPSSSSTRTKTASAPSAARKKPGYYSKDLEKLPRHDRRRIEREIRKRRKPGESYTSVHQYHIKMNWGHVYYSCHCRTERGPWIEATSVYLLLATPISSSNEYSTVVSMM